MRLKIVTSGNSLIQIWIQFSATPNSSCLISQNTASTLHGVCSVGSGICGKLETRELTTVMVSVYFMARLWSAVSDEETAFRDQSRPLAVGAFMSTGQPLQAVLACIAFICHYICCLVVVCRLQSYSTFAPHRLSFNLWDKLFENEKTKLTEPELPQYFLWNAVEDDLKNGNICKTINGHGLP